MFCRYFNNQCNEEFIGPIKDINTNAIFYFSMSIKDMSKLNDYNFYYNWNTTTIGYVFGLYQMNSIFFKSNITDKQDIIINYKNLKNLGSNIENIFLIPDGFPQKGIIINYNNGDVCNKENNYTTFLFALCSKDNENKSPKYFGTSDNCSLIFEWPTKYACPICLRSEIESITQGKCINNLIDIINYESKSCIIEEIQENSKETYIPSLNQKNLKEFEPIEFYFINKYPNHTFQINNKSNSDFVYKKVEQLDCYTNSFDYFNKLTINYIECN